MGMLLDNAKIKKGLLFTAEILIILCVSFFIVRFVNRDVVIKALHLDDLENYLHYIKDPSLKSWIFDYYPDRMHYRPFFYILLFNIFHLLHDNVQNLLIINISINAIVATIIYFQARRLNIHRIFCISLILLYAHANYSYFQLYQAIGCIEALPLAFSLIILTNSVLSINFDSKKFVCYTIFSLVLYFIMVFTHERYFPMMLLILIAIKLNKNISKNTKIKLYIASWIEFFIFFGIRYYYLGIIVPRGTSCTSLIEHFDLARSFKHFFIEVMYILGVNLGPKHLSGINFFDTNLYAKILALLGIIVVLGILVLNIINNHKNFVHENKKDKLPYIGRFFFLYIFLCILQSSLTIRVEMRWVYASFVALAIYISYISSVAITNAEIVFLEPASALQSEDKNVKYGTILAFLFVIFFIVRFMTFDYYKKYNNNIFIVNEQYLVNSLAELTVEKYGIDKIRKMKIYVTSDNYKVISEKERWHFFDQFDRKTSNKEMIMVNENPDVWLEALQDKNSIVLYESALFFDDDENFSLIYKSLDKMPFD